MIVATIVGARPQFIKCAPVSRELRQHATEILIHTGQHYDKNMSQVFFAELGIPCPDHNLGVGSGTQGAQSGEMLKRIEKALLLEKPDWVLLYGETNSTLAGALAAAKLCIPVAHVEAGLRSHDRSMPEEVNRIVVDHLSALLLCPTETAMRNLSREGIREGVELVGDVTYDALLDSIHVAEQRSVIARELGLIPKTYCVATVHRAANTDDPVRLRSIVKALQQISGYMRVIWPLHPRTRRRLELNHGPDLGNHALEIVEPVPYLDMLMLERNASMLITDSSSVQKEAYWLGVPCITLREETEWPETLEGGWNTLTGANTQSIVDAARSRLTLQFAPQGTTLKERASPRIVRLLLDRHSAPVITNSGSLSLTARQFRHNKRVN